MRFRKLKLRFCLTLLKSSRVTSIGLQRNTVQMRLSDFTTTSSHAKKSVLTGLNTSTPIHLLKRLMPKFGILFTIAKKMIDSSLREWDTSLPMLTQRNQNLKTSWSSIELWSSKNPKKRKLTLANDDYDSLFINSLLTLRFT